ncbi:MAG TPA: hypothetical protein VF682_13140 [Pseudomonas sp.]|jgi:hypothetical protein
MNDQNTPRGAMVMVPADPALNLNLGWAYLDAAREAEPGRNWAFSLPGYRALIAAYQTAPAAGGQTSSLNGKPDDYESRRSWTVKDWYTHLGAWENEKGQLCFGSTIAFAIMLEQFHRTHAAPLATYVDYVTQPAESLAGIACRQLKDERRWIEIRDINAHAFPDMAPHDYYPVGTSIKLPRQ